MRKTRSFLIAITGMVFAVLSFQNGQGIFAQTADATNAQNLVFKSSTQLRLNDPNFGGWSGLHLSPDGLRLIAVSDRGHFMEANIGRVNGEVASVSDLTIQPIRQINGENTTDHTADAEGLAIDDNGQVFVSFEGFHRVRAHQDLGAKARAVPSHKNFKKLQNNSGLEALAIDGKGRLYAIPERSGALTRPFPLYRFSGGSWAKLGAIPRAGDYLVVGADIGPDGRLYVLERAFSGITFSTRIRSFALGAKGPHDMAEHLTTRKGRFDNLEGISVWRAPSGRIRVSLISDDNFLFLLGTDLVEFELAGSL